MTESVSREALIRSVASSSAISTGRSVKDLTQVLEDSQVIQKALEKNQRRRDFDYDSVALVTDHISWQMWFEVDIKGKVVVMGFKCFENYLELNGIGLAELFERKGWSLND